MTIKRQIIFYLILVIISILNYSCITSYMLHRTPGSMLGFHNDSLINIENTFVDSNNNLTINFEAKLKNKKTKKYNLKINLLKEKYSIKVNSLSSTAQIIYKTKDPLIGIWYIDSVEHGRVKSGIYNCLCFNEVKRKRINLGFDTSEQSYNRISNSNFNSINYDIYFAYDWRSNELRTSNIDGNSYFTMDSYCTAKTISFNYFPDTNLNKCIYSFQIKQRKKYDKRYLKIFTIPLDIATSPIQIIYYFIRRI